MRSLLDTVFFLQENRMGDILPEESCSASLISSKEWHSFARALLQNVPDELFHHAPSLSRIHSYWRRSIQTTQKNSVRCPSYRITTIGNAFETRCSAGQALPMDRFLRRSDNTLTIRLMLIGCHTPSPSQS